MPLKIRSFSPTLKCQNLANDYYTIKSAYKGNNALINPVGLITADEAALAGGTYLVSNLSYYLYTVNPYWTMSPYSCDGSADVFFVNSDGILNNIDVNDTRLGVRPVINLSATTNFSGSGTVGDPYVVVD